MGKRIHTLFFASIASAIPQVSLPLNAQIPPVALVSRQFEFQFSASSFSTFDGGSLQYEIQGAPSWLALDSSSRTLSGRPSSSDVGTSQFSVVATDQSGSTPMVVSLVVADSSPIEVTSDVTSQLGRHEALLDVNSVAIRTGANFSIVFDSTTFEGADDLFYFAVSGDRSPLPSWVTFNPGALAFSGTAPTQIAIPQTFGVCLLASKIPNFSEGSICFSLVINEHQLVFEPFERDVSISRGSPLSFTNLSSQLYLDGSLINPDAIIGAFADVPDWLNFNASTLSLSGLPPPDTTSQTINVRASDRYGDNAHALINFQFASTLFKSEIGVLNATIGTYFSYDFANNFFADRAINVTLSLAPDLPWLGFNPQNLTLQGEVPSGATPTSYNISISATSSTQSTAEGQTFQFRLVEEPPSGTSGLPSTGGNSGNMSASKKAEIAAAVLGSILGLAIIGIAVWFLVTNRREKRRATKEKRPVIKVIHDPEEAVSRQEKDPAMVDTTRQPSVDERGLPYPAPPMHRRHRSRSSQPLPLKSAPVRRTADGFETIAMNEVKSHTGELTDRSSFGLDAPSDLSKLSSFLGVGDRRSGLNSRDWRRSGTTRRSYVSTLNMNMGYPPHRRLSGFGHGRPVNGVGSPGSGSSKKRARNSYSSQRSTTHSLARDSFLFFPLNSPRLSRSSTSGCDRQRSSRISTRTSVSDRRRTYIRAWYDAARPPSFMRQKRITIRKVGSEKGVEDGEGVSTGEPAKSIATGGEETGEEEEEVTSVGFTRIPEREDVGGEREDTRPLEERRQSWVRRRASNTDLGRPFFSARDDTSSNPSFLLASRLHQGSTASNSRVRRPILRRWSESSELVPSTPHQQAEAIAESTRASATSLWEDVASSQDALESEAEAERGEEMLLEESLWEDVRELESPTGVGADEGEYTFQFGPGAMVGSEAIGVALGTPSYRAQTMEEELNALLQLQTVNTQFGNLPSGINRGVDDHGDEVEERGTTQAKGNDAFV